MQHHLEWRQHQNHSGDSEMQAGLLLRVQKGNLYQVWEQWTEFLPSMQVDFYNHSEVISRVVFCHLLHDGTKSKCTDDFAFSK